MVYEFQNLENLNISKTNGTQYCIQLINSKNTFIENVCLRDVKTSLINY